MRVFIKELLYGFIRAVTISLSLRTQEASVPAPRRPPPVAPHRWQVTETGACFLGDDHTCDIRFSTGERLFVTRALSLSPEQFLSLLYRLGCPELAESVEAAPTSWPYDNVIELLLVCRMHDLLVVAGLIIDDLIQHEV